MVLINQYSTELFVSYYTPFEEKSNCTKLVLKQIKITFSIEKDQEVNSTELSLQ